MEEYKTLKKLITEGNLEESVLYSLSIIKDKKVSIIDLYEKILGPVLNHIECEQSEEECIWFEHQQTAIVRTIIDAVFPYMIDRKAKPIDKKVLIICPSEEYHEIGARMAHDFFYLLGYQTTFVGANTPLDNVLSAIKLLNPDYLAISVTNFYNIISAKLIVEKVRNIDPSITILGGGQAFLIKEAKNIAGIDRLLFTYEDITSLKEEK